MLPTAFMRAVDQFDPADTIVVEFHSGERLLVWDRQLFLATDEWCSYTDDQSVSHFFDPSTVSRVMGWTSLPDLTATPYPYRNGLPKPPA